MAVLMLLYCALSTMVTMSIKSEVTKVTEELAMFDSEDLVGHIGRSKRQIQNRTLCPSLWTTFNGHCYQVSTTTVSWNTAEQECRRLNAYLVEIDSEAENRFVLQFLRRSSGTVVNSTSSHPCFDVPFSDHTWIGLNDMQVEGSFVWAHSNATPIYTNWALDKLDNWLGNEDCVELVGDRNHWNDAGCDCKKPYVCEMEAWAPTTIAAATTITAAATTTPVAIMATTTATSGTTVATTATTVATTAKNPEISILFAVGFAAIGFVTALMMTAVVACAVQWRRRRHSKRANSGASAEKSSPDHGQTSRSEIACSALTNIATYPSRSDCQGQDNLAYNYSSVNKLPLSADKGRPTDGQENYITPTCGDYTEGATYDYLDYRRGQSTLAGDDGFYENDS